MALPMLERDQEVIITPTGRSTVTLEGGFDAIYAQLLTIKADARLVPYAHKPVELAGGRVLVEVDLIAGPAALAVTEDEEMVPQRTKRVWPRPRLPQWERDTWHLIGWWTAATVSLAVIAGLVWGAVIAAQVIAAFISAWAAPLSIGGVLVLGGVGMAFERHERTKAEQAAAQAEIIAAAAQYEDHHHRQANPLAAVTKARPTAAANQATIPAPEYHWLTGRQITAEVARDQVWAKVTQAEPAPSRYTWWGGLTEQAKLADQQERFARLDPRAQLWVQDLRDPSSKQAKGTYDDGAGRYCAVGIETHKHRRMSHQQMQRAFGARFVREVENYNDGTKASFEDVARYIEDNLS